MPAIMNDSRRLPQGRLARLTKMAALGARAGASLLVDKGASGAAERAAEVLGGMRGLAAKVGQIASYVDGLVPENNREAFEGALSKLRTQTASSPFPDVRRVIEEDLGGPLDRLFDSFDERPFASASIGQVHRATLGDVEVAVKVQHHGISAAVESDLASASMLEPLASLAGGGKISSKQVLGEMRARLREELDYVLEAERQMAFRALHEGDPRIRVPNVFPHRSGARVLTSELVKGATLEDIGAAPEGERRAWAETLWRFVFKGNLVGGMFNADPHPGNYVFHDPGVVTFLDFGCVEPLPPGRREKALGLHRAAISGDEREFARHAALLLETRGGRWEELAVDYSRRCFEPLFASPFRITRPFAAELVQRLKLMGKELRHLPKGEHVPVPKGMVFMNRLQCGFYSVLARLDVEVDYRDVEARFLTEAGL
jgi:predicted unusual protein kinase regulating ubiquinone biosynthesis (AarF/ABC1/UbiB family)